MYCTIRVEDRFSHAKAHVLETAINFISKDVHFSVKSINLYAAYLLHHFFELLVKSQSTLITRS